MAEKSNYIGSYLSWIMDSYDLGAVVITASILEKLFYPSLGLLGAVLPIVFTVVSRPLGGFVFGLLSDLRGRKLTLVITVIGYSFTIGATGLLPTYYQIGILAPLALSVLRIVQGIFIGGDVSSSFTLAMESSLKRRGILSGIMQSGTLVGFVLVDLLFTKLASETFFLSYGWRIIFIVGIIPAVLAAVIRSKLSESKVFMEEKRGTEREVIQGLKPIFQTLGVMIGFWVMIYAGPQFVPVLLGTVMKLPPAEYGYLSLLMNLIGIPSMLLSGLLSDRIGRRTMGIVGSLASLAVASLFYIGAMEGLPLLSLILIFGFGINLPSAISPAYLAERFRTLSRATGVGFSYNGAFLIAGFSSIYISLFSRVTSPYVGALIVVGIGAIISTVSLMMGPETLRMSELKVDSQ
ncbi:MFS transporter [Sulfuracidifex tepidarius]|uniref:Sialic acid transporter n=1 Tax=Sulfuracidifex tepidarius TaxID=1294262 RepID=A0A510DZ02_9CREN|nr:MFS transporter [Sulfuracidifex tepidarius]BBG25180.1 Putative sialic acid transporter [Sulfuracidifex tepidarius]BBG27973.1 Putative sialic acid transporter [Sulfuracidifex tepidarius]